MELSTSEIVMPSMETEYTPEAALYLGKLLGVENRTVTVGRELNLTSEMIGSAMIAGLVSMGVNVIDAGVAPIPAVAMVGRNTDCTVYITSMDAYGSVSKPTLMKPDGSLLSPEQFRHLMRLADSVPVKPSYRALGTVIPYDRTLEEYKETLIKFFKYDQTPVIIDCGCGSTSLCTPHILSAAGADVMTINSQADSRYPPRTTDLGKTHAIRHISDIVHSTMGQIGIAFNGDGSGIAMVDENGTVLEKSDIQALIVLYTRPKTLVLPLDSPSIIEDAFWGDIGQGINTEKEHPAGKKIVFVGGTNQDICDAADEFDADLAITINGYVLFSDIINCPDATYTTMLITEMSNTNIIKGLLETIPEYYRLTETLNTSMNKEIFSKKLHDILNDIDHEEMHSYNGWRVAMENGWFSIILNSNDNVVSITVESEDQIYAISLMEYVKGLLSFCC